MSELLVNTIKKADGTGSLAIPAESGTVVTTASPSLGRRNLIINGAMQVAQRGTSSASGGTNTVDRWNVGGNISISQAQSSLSSSDEPYTYGFRNYLRATNTGTTSATNAYAQFLQKIESQNVANSGWNYPSSSSNITLSFWARSSLAGTYYCDLRSNDGTNQQYCFAFTLTANTWTKITKTVPGDSNLVFNNDNGVGLTVHIWLDLGTDYTDSGTTLNSWAAFASGNQSPDFVQKWGNTASATWDITGVQLEVGSVATPFEHRSYGEELALCQRYYWAFADGTNTDQSTLIGLQAGVGTMEITYPVTMRTDPAVVVLDSSPYWESVPYQVAGTSISGMTASIANGHLNGGILYVAGTFSPSMSRGFNYGLQVGGTFAFNAEL